MRRAWKTSAQAATVTAAVRHGDPDPSRADGDREGRNECEREHEQHPSDRQAARLQPEPGTRDEGAGEQRRGGWS